MATMHTGDVGTLIKLNTSDDVSGASAVYVKYRKPDGTTGQWAGVASSTYVQYTTQSGDLDTAGTWAFQAYVVGLSGWTGHGNAASQAVVDPIDA